MGSLKKSYYAVPHMIFLQGSPYISVFITPLSVFKTNLSLTKRCVAETQCPRQWPIPTEANITWTNILIPAERNNYHVHYESSSILRSYDQCQIFSSNVKVKRMRTYKKISSQGIFIYNISISKL